MNLNNILLEKQKVKMSYFKKDFIHLNKKGAKALAKEIKRELSYLLQSLIFNSIHSVFL